jgi:hypothetical protein
MWGLMHSEAASRWRFGHSHGNGLVLSMGLMKENLLAQLLRGAQRAILSKRIRMKYIQ